MIYKTLMFCSCSILALLLAACSSTNHKSTAFPYEINQAAIKAEKVQRVLIANINFASDSRNFLKRHEERIDKLVADYLQKNDYTIQSSRLFANLWQKQLRTRGSLYNPDSGQPTELFKQTMKQTLHQLFSAQPKLDAVVFTQLIVTPIEYGNASKRTAQWNGVTRKVKVQGLGEGFSTDFNWLQQVNGISLSVYVVNRQQEIIFHSMGGIQVAEALEVHNKSGKFVRRNDLLEKDKEVNEGIKLAFHPLIKMKKYPGLRPTDEASQSILK